MVDKLRPQTNNILVKFNVTDTVIILTDSQAIFYTRVFFVAIQDFNFTSNKKTSNPTSKQAVLAMDSETDVASLSKVLKQQRYHVLANTVQLKEIIEVCRKHKNGIIFLDFDIEKLSSMENLSKIKINFPNFKVVLTANVMDKQQVLDAKKNGVAGFLAKPLTPESIEKLLSKSDFD